MSRSSTHGELPLRTRWLAAGVCGLLLFAPSVARSETTLDELAGLLEGREICYDQSGLIVRNTSPTCGDSSAAHKLDDGSETAQLEGLYWLGVWLRSHTPGLKPWNHKRRLSFDEVLKLLEPAGNGLIYRHPKQPPWNNPWSADAGTSVDQLIPLIAAMGVWGKEAELHRLWNALPEDLLGKHAFDGTWVNLLGQPGSNCTEIRNSDCGAARSCEGEMLAKYQSCQVTNLFTGDLIGADVVNLYLRAANVNPTSVLLADENLQGGIVGERELMIKVYGRIAETSSAREHLRQQRNTLASEMSLIVQLLMAKLRFPTFISDAAALQYAHLRAHNYGSWLGAYYKVYGSDTGDDALKKRIENGIANGWRPDVSPVTGLVRWFLRPSSGGNPQIATLYAPIIDRFLGAMPGPFAAQATDAVTHGSDDIAQLIIRAADFASFYWAHIANENEEAIQFLSSAYTDSVDYYGRRTAKQTVIAEKRRFVQRWPERNYRPRSNDTSITCEAQNQQCTIQGIADFAAKNAARGKQERGSFHYTITVKLVDGSFRIVAENSNVVDRK